jgi:hypothetical protein
MKMYNCMHFNTRQRHVVSVTFQIIYTYVKNSWVESWVGSRIGVYVVAERRIPACAGK